MTNKRVRIISFLFIWMFSAAAVFANGDNYYVSPSGSDADDGSQNRSWKTLHHAVSQLNAKAQGNNFTLNVSQGTYSISESHSREPDAGLVISRSMTIIGHPETVIDGTGASQWKCGFEIEASDVTIRNLRIRGFQEVGGAGVRLVSGNRNILDQSQFYDNRNGIVIQQLSLNNEIRNGCTAYHNLSSGLLIDGSVGNRIFGNQSGFSDNGSAQTSGAGIRLINGAASNIISLNHIFNTGNADYQQAVGVYVSDAGPGNIIDRNFVSGHSYPNPLPDADHNGAGFRIINSSPVIEQNFIGDNHKGIDIAAESSADAASPVIRNNLIYSSAPANQEWGIYMTNDGGTVSPDIFHNTIDSGSSGIEAAGAHPVIRYNIITNFKYGILSDASGLSVDYNNVWNNSLSNYSGCAPGAHDISLNPKYTGNGDYSLLPDSPCIDAIPFSEHPVSTDLLGRRRPVGSGFDMGCFETSKSDQYILNVQLSPADGGSVSDNLTILSCSGSLCTGSYSQNDSVTLTAAPASGFTFERWEGDVFGSSNPITISVNSNKTVRAVFSTTYTLSVQISGAGTVSDGGSAICDENCIYSVKSGTSVTLTAAPAQGFRFVRWEGDIAGTGMSVQFEMTGNKTARAVFSQAFSLSASVSEPGKGTITVNDATCEDACVRHFDHGASVTLKAQPADGYVFDRWEGDLTGTVNPSVITLNSDKTVRAVFVAGFVLTTTVVGSGKITADGTDCPDNCTQRYKANTAVTLTAVPSDGYRFDRWEGGLTGSANVATISMTEDRSVRAVFVRLAFNTLTVTVSPSGSGSVSVSGMICSDRCSYEFPTGSELTLTAAPASGWMFPGWNGAPTQKIVMDSDKSVPVQFVSIPTQKVSLSVSLGTDAGGSVTGDGIACPDDCTEAYSGGVSVTLTAVASDAYQFDRWEGDLTGKANPAALVMTSDKTVSPVFILKSDKAVLTVLMHPSGSGTVSGPGVSCPPDCSEAYTIGTAVHLTASPAANFRFNHWYSPVNALQPEDLSKNPINIVIRSAREMQAFFAEKDNLPPYAPEALRPANESIFSSGPVAVRISPFSDPEGDAHLQTVWRVRRADRSYECSDCDPSFNHLAISGPLTEHVISGVYPGLKYAWIAGVTDSGSFKTSWAVRESFFKIGTPVTDNSVHIPKGNSIRDYRMTSVHMWLNDPSSVRAFENTIKGYYDRNNFRIGTYDPVAGGYTEYGPGMKIEPGKAFWLLARNGMNVSATGVPVSMSHDIDVELKYQPLTGNGWNMIACPNNALYLWKQVQIIVYAQNGSVVFGPVSVSLLDDNNPYLDKRLWRWENGAYFPDADRLQPYFGYWVKARSGRVYLRFPVSARNQSVHDGLLTNRTLDKSLQTAIKLLSPGSAAASGDYPPMPMEAFTDAGKQTDDQNSSCFIDSIQR